MPSNKLRLYVTLHARGSNPDKFHWALLVGPKKEVDNARGTRYHAVDRVVGPGKPQWFFEEVDTDLYTSNMLLVRVAIAKIEKPDRFRDILRSVPVRPDVVGWNCVGWVQDALRALEADGGALGNCALEWEKVREAAVDYCNEKRAAHRFDGKGEYDTRRPPTFDLMKNTEVIP